MGLKGTPLVVMFPITVCEINGCHPQGLKSSLRMAAK
jgi:hypothetical protein